MTSNIIYTLDGLNTINADIININGQELDMTLYVLTSYLQSNNYTKTQINNIEVRMCLHRHIILN